ncbi:M81 family metallopeptidase [Rhizobium sp. BT03]|uniref:M81 family metallopeptidase n=1 Tax=Rhizobium sp. BT03 TaxID=3045156 RepID=UPI0024B3CF13|nr:M81 family metallopeptidase [Rhizobium sp. BT03]WHO77300.1 M81 family metallopeptidase [Rhizobium sp. BT03]
MSVGTANHQPVATGKKMKLGVFQLVHEANSFALNKCDQKIFAEGQWARGHDAAKIEQNSDTELGAVFSFLETHTEWQVTFFRLASASPCGDVTNACFSAVRDELVADIKADTWDALYLCLHGAATVEGGRSAELEVLRAIRTILPDVPIGVSFDMHANLDPELAHLATIAAGYKTHPHIDIKQVAAKVLRLLLSTVRGDIRPTGAIVKLPLLLPSANMRTTDGPMREVVSYAALVEQQQGALDVTVYGGFPYGDCTMSGACCMVYTDNDPALAHRVARDVAGKLWSLKEQFFVPLPSTKEALQSIANTTRYPIAIADNADNPDSGGIADTPSQLRAILDADLAIPTAFCFLLDPELVERCHKAGIGARFRARLGGRLTPEYGPPVECEVEVVRLIEDCSFNNEGPQCTGARRSYGPTAVVKSGNVEIVLATVRHAVTDPGFYRVNGIDFSKIKLLAVKAKNHFRAAFSSVFADIIAVDEPGPAAYGFTNLKFTHVPDEFYPMNPTATFWAGNDPEEEVLLEQEKTST